MNDTTTTPQPGDEIAPGITVVEGRPYITVDEPQEYVDRTLATASWWDRYELVPGDYEVEPCTIAWHATSNLYDAATYYVRVRVTAILKESYRVNRLFTASSSETTYPETETTVDFHMYAYEAKAGKPLHGFEIHDLDHTSDIPERSTPFLVKEFANARVMSALSNVGSRSERSATERARLHAVVDELKARHVLD